MKPKLRNLSPRSLTHWITEIPNWSAFSQCPVYFEPCDEVYAKLGWLLVNSVSIDTIPIYDTTILPEDATVLRILSLNSFEAIKLPNGIKVTFNITKQVTDETILYVWCR